MTCMAFKIQIPCLMNELIVHNTQGLCRTKNLVLQLSVESDTLHKHGQTLSQTAADFQSCVKPSLLSFSICGMHLENYKWEKKASISNIL